MTLKIVDVDNELDGIIHQSIGISKMKSKCILITNIEGLRNKNDTDKFWMKNQNERKKRFKEYLADVLI